MVDGFTSIQLVQTFLNFYPEPFIVIKMMLHNLLHDALRSALFFRCDPVDLIFRIG